MGKYVTLIETKSAKHEFKVTENEQIAVLCHPLENRNLQTIITINKFKKTSQALQNKDWI